jgi:polyisoprenoid-binding protein YceI
MTAILARLGGRCQDEPVSRYQIDAAQSRVMIDARSNVHPIHSVADGLSGFIDFDTEHPAGQVSFPVTKLSSGNPLERRELQKRIEARRYPTIDGTLTGMEALAEPGRFRVAGDLSFRGVMRSVEGEITVTDLDDRTIRIDGAATFDIRAFDMQPPRVLMLRVEPEVDVRIEIIAERINQSR